MGSHSRGGYMSKLFTKEGEAPAEPFKMFDKGVLQQLSPTMINEYKSCPQKAGFRRVLGVKKQGKRYFAKGGAFDVATEHLFRRVGGGKKANVKDAVDLAIKEYEERVAKDEVDLGPAVLAKAAMSEDRDHLNRMLLSYWTQLGSKVRVSSRFEPQTEVVVTLKSGLKVMCVFDVIEEVDGGKKLNVVDVKTAKSAWREGKE